MRAFSLLVAPHVVAVVLRCSQNAPLPLVAKFVKSVLGLSPVTFSARDRLTSELLRTL